MESSVNRDKLLLKILYFIRFFGDSFFYSFFQLFIASRVMDEGKIGFILAITPVISILVNPFWNFLSKDANRNRSIMRIITVFEGVLIALIGNLEAYELLIVFTGLIAVVGTPFYSLFDGFTATFSDTYHFEYSKFRRLGSLAYIFGCSIGGLLINLWGYSPVFLIAGVLFIISGIIASIIKPIKITDKEGPKRDFKAVLTNKYFYLYVLFYVLTFSVATLGDNFFGVFLVRERGMNDMLYGNLVSGWVITEFITMVVLGWIGKKFKDYQLFILIGVIYLLRLYAVGFNMNTQIIIVCALLRGVSMGTILYIHLAHLKRIVGVENITGAILVIAIVTSVVSALGNFFGGNLIKVLGYQKVFMFLAWLVSFATIGYSMIALVYHSKKNDDKI